MSDDTVPTPDGAPAPGPKASDVPPPPPPSVPAPAPVPAPKPQPDPAPAPSSVPPLEGKRSGTGGSEAGSAGDSPPPAPGDSDSDGGSGSASSDVAGTAPGSNTRVLGLLCHLLALTGIVLPLGHLIAPGLLWWLKRKSIPVVETEGRKSVNFQIAFSIVFGVLLMLQVGAWIMSAIIPFLGTLMSGLLLVAFVAAVVADAVFVVMATMKVSNGEQSQYPVSYDFLKKIEDAVSADRRERGE